MSNFVKKTEQFAFFNSIFLREPLKCRGEMRQHLPTDYGIHPNSWLEASTKAQCSLLTAHCSLGYWLPS